MVNIFTIVRFRRESREVYEKVQLDRQNSQTDEKRSVNNNNNKTICTSFSVLVRK